MKKNLLWITDPWSTLDYPNDTTLRLMQESTQMGHVNFWCDVKSIRLENQKAHLTATQVIEVDEIRSEAAFTFAHPRTYSPDDFYQIHYRVDPPVDLAYLHPLQMIAAYSKKSQIINPPSILFSANEKWEGMLLPKLTPPTLVSSDSATILDFARKHEKLVLKPLHTAQSKGIELIDLKSESIEAKRQIKLASNGYKNPIQLQKFLPKISVGETRLWFANGKLIAHATKLPIPGDFRVNIDLGSIVEANRLSARDKKAASQISSHLKKRKIRLAAVDLIDGFITDFNFTSPGLIVQMEAATGTNIARKIIQSLVKKA